MESASTTEIGTAVETLTTATRQIQRVVLRLPDLIEREFGLTPNRVAALNAVAAGATRVQDVATATWTSVSATSRTVDALVTDGLLDRRPEPGNRRAAVLTLTSDGERVMADLEAWRHGLLARIVTDLGVERSQRVAEDLVAFAEHLEREVSAREAE
jgi:DNA-binding MarR family transcriptional regulator